MWAGRQANAKIKEEEVVDIHFLELTIIDTYRIYYRKISKKNINISPFRFLRAPP
jgi:hypothetical protein